VFSVADEYSSSFSSRVDGEIGMGFAISQWVIRTWPVETGTVRYKSIMQVEQSASRIHLEWIYKGSISHISSDPRLGHSLRSEIPTRNQTK
jgi:hypothetical protein